MVMKNLTDDLVRTLKFTISAVLCAAMAIGVSSARAADADVTGLVPTIWWDFETQPDASELPGANKGSASISFKGGGDPNYEKAVVTNGWALDTSASTPYSSNNNSFSTAGGAFTVSLVMNLGSTPGGITLNLCNETGNKDLIVRRGSDEGSLVIGLGPHKAASTQFLNATFADGDKAFHLVSVVFRDTGTELYVDGALADSTASATLWSASGCASRLQFGSHLGNPKGDEAMYGGLIDDLRIHDAALTPAQIKAIGRDVGLLTDLDFIDIVATGGDIVTKDAFSTSWKLDVAEGRSAEAGLVYGTDAALSNPTTNALGAALSAGDYTASLAGLDPGTTYWWKIVAGNGVNWAETPVSSFRTHDAVDARNFTKRIPVTVFGYAGTETLENFPVLVKLAAGEPAGFDYGDCATDGSDLRFAAADGTMLSHEVESWNPNGTSYVWVKVPALAGTATAFDLFYGADPATLPAVDPTDVWTRYAVVIHGGDELKNAVGNGLGVAAGSEHVKADGGAGMAGGGIRKAEYNSVGVNVDEPSPKLSDAGRFSVSGWFKRDGKGGNNNNGTHILMANRKSWRDNGEGFAVLTETGSRLSVSYKGGHTWTTGTNLVSAGFAPGEWGHVAFSYDKPGLRLVSYLNGIQDNESDSPKNLENSDSTLAYWTFGSFGNNSTVDCFRGDMDELRVFNGFASGDWIRAEHDTVADPASFVSLSPAELNDLDLPRFGAFSASDENGVVTFSIALDRPAFGGEVPTSVSVFYGTDGEKWTELSLGATNETSTLSGTASGLTGNVRYLWYAVASATQGDEDKTATSTQRYFVSNVVEPAGAYKSFKATVDWDGEPVANVPVLLRISETAITGFDYDDVTESRFEILGADGHLLPYEIDTWNTDGESLVWVLLPDYRDGATFTVRYGAPFANTPIPSSNIWAGYKGVWHMNSVDPADSTSSGFNGTHTTDNLSVVSGAIGSAVNVPRKDNVDGISCGQVIPNSELTDGFTVAGWCRPMQYGSMGDGAAMFGKKDFISVRIKDATHVIVTTPTVENLEMSLASGVLPAVGEWWHFAVTFKMKTANNGLNFYVNGQLAYSRGAGDIADKTGTTELFLGNNQWKQAFKGDLDEMRLSAGIRSANEIAAEYHAMADAGAISFSSVSSSDISGLILGIPSVAGNPDGSFTVSVEVSENTPASIVCIVGETEVAMTTSGASLPAIYTATFSQLVTGTHVATVRATATSGTVVSSTCPTAFHAGSLTIVKQSDADEITLLPGVFRVARADADATGLPALTFDVAFSGPGLAAIVEPTVASLTIPAGAASVDISVTPIYTTEVDADVALTLSVSGAFVGTPSSGSITIVNATYNPAVRYVATTGDDANHGGTPESPKKTIGAAVDSLASISQTLPCTVHVAPGIYTLVHETDNPIVVTNAIRIVGDGTTPENVIVQRTERASANSSSFRSYHDCSLFHLNHPDALVANLVMNYGSAHQPATDTTAGSAWIGADGGTISNCVVRGGQTTHPYAVTPGILVVGPGLVTHCVITNNVGTSRMETSWGNTMRGNAVVLKGAGSRLENCLIRDNRSEVEGGTDSDKTSTVCAQSTASIVNCTIIGNRARNCGGVLADGTGVTVQNCVIAGNVDVGATADNPNWMGSGTFLSCATDDAIAINENCFTGTASSFFKDYANGDYTPMSGGPLVNKGTNYEGMASVDLAGNPRKAGKRIDIGCYEAQSSPLMIIVR